MQNCVARTSASLVTATNRKVATGSASGTSHGGRPLHRSTLFSLATTRHVRRPVSESVVKFHEHGCANWVFALVTDAVPRH